MSFPPRATAVARKRPWPFCQKCRWQVKPKHAYTLDPTKSEWADYAAVQAQCGNLSGNVLTRNLSENIRPQSSQPAEPLWIVPDIKIRISVRELISTLSRPKHSMSQNAEILIKESVETCLTRVNQSFTGILHVARKRVVQTEGWS